MVWATFPRPEAREAPRPSRPFDAEAFPWGLDGAKTGRREGESCAKPNDCRGVEQQSERHDRILVAEIHGLDREARTPKCAWP
jgi:hypothetical protein